MKALLEWDKSGQSKEKDKDFSKREKMTLSLQSSKESKINLLLILSSLERIIPIPRKFLTSLSNFLEAFTIDNAAAKCKEVKTSIDEMKQPEFNQLKQHYHHQKQHHKDKPNLHHKQNNLFKNNLQ